MEGNSRFWQCVEFVANGKSKEN